MACFRAVLGEHREIIPADVSLPVTQALSRTGLIGSRNTVSGYANRAGEPALSIDALVGSEGEVSGSILRPRW